MRILQSFPAIATITFSLFAADSPTVLANKNPGYSHEKEAKTNNPSWMSALKDDVTLNQLSIPGTHDTMAFYGGDIKQTQTMRLPDQLKSGIRVLDIRCRRVDDAFAIYHGSVSQNASFSDVLDDVVAFLKKHPGETVLMRIKEESSAKNTKKSFTDIFSGYWNNEKYSAYFFVPNNADNPTLGQLRGKMMVLSDFKSEKKYGIPYPSKFTIQDDYKLGQNSDLYGKWIKVKAQLKAANKVVSTNEKFINYLSGSGGSFPYFVASGHSSPGTSAPRLATGRTTPGWKGWRDFPRVNCLGRLCTIAYEGTNILTYERLGKDYKNYVGVIMADFPGPGLIEKTINLNNKFKKTS